MTIESIPTYEMPKPYADESFRLIDDDDNGSESDNKENNVESDNDEFVFIYDGEIALVIE